MCAHQYEKNISSCTTPTFAWQKHRIHDRSAVQSDADDQIRECNISWNGVFPFNKCSKMYAWACGGTPNSRNLHKQTTVCRVLELKNKKIDELPLSIPRSCMSGEWIPNFCKHLRRSWRSGHKSKADQKPAARENPMKQRESPDRGQQKEAQEKAQQGQGPELPARSFDWSSQHDTLRQMKLIVGFSRANLGGSRHSAFSLYVCLGNATRPTPIDHSAVLPSQAIADNTYDEFGRGPHGNSHRRVFHLDALWCISKQLAMSGSWLHCHSNDCPECQILGYSTPLSCWI